MSDEFLALWSRFVMPFRTSLDSGNHLPAVRYLDEHFIDRHVAFVFEDVCRQVLRSTLESFGVAATYGTYWDNGVEIDVAALDGFTKTLYLGVQVLGGPCGFQGPHIADVEDRKGR